MARSRSRSILACLAPVLIGALAGLGAACTGGGGGNGVPVKIAGTVRSSSGAAVPGATVSIGSATVATSDPQGVFSTSTSQKGSSVVLRVTASGYAPQYHVVSLKTGVTRYVAPVSMTALQQSTFNAAAGTTVAATAVGQPVQVVIPPNAFPASAGTLTVRLGSYDYRTGPGTLMGPSGPGGRLEPLQSAGMFYVEVVDSNGNPVQMNPAAGGIRVSYPTFSMAPVTGARPTQLWTLNTSSGNWGSPNATGEPESGIQLTGIQPGTVFNCDRGFPGACVRGRVRSAASGCTGQGVQATGPTGTASRDFTGSAGEFCVLAPVNGSITLRTGATTMGTATAASSFGDCSVPSSCVDLGDIDVPSADCNRETAPAPTPPGPPTSCTGFQCANGGPCISASLVCNGTNNCPGGDDENPSICANQLNCCQATQGCPGETGSSCTATCCCCPVAQACCADRSGCCAAP